MRPDQRAAHRRRRGDGAPAARPRRRGRGHRHDDAANSGDAGEDRRARSIAGRTAARLGAAARAVARADGQARTSRRPAATSRRAEPSPRTSRRCRRWARAIVSGPDHVLEAPDGLHSGLDVSLRGVGHGHRDGAAGRGECAGRHRDPPRGHRTACRRAVRVPGEDGRRCHGHRQLEASHRGRAASSMAPAHRLGGDYIEAGSWAVVAAITGGEIAIEGAREEDIEVVAVSAASG